MTGQTQGLQQPALGQGQVDLLHPPLLKARKPAREGVTQVGGQQPPGLVPVASATAVGAGDHRAQVPQADLVDHGCRRLGPVQPASRLEAGQQLLGHGYERFAMDLRKPLGSGSLLLGLYCLAHRRQPAP